MKCKTTEFTQPGERTEGPGKSHHSHVRFVCSSWSHWEGPYVLHFTSSCSAIFAVWFADAKCATRASVTSRSREYCRFCFWAWRQRSSTSPATPTQLWVPGISACTSAWGRVPGTHPCKANEQPIANRLSFHLKVCLCLNLTICSFHFIFL